MTDNFEIVPYKTQHGDEMIEFGLNDKLMDIDASFTENRIDFALAGLSFTLLHNNNPLCSGGIVPLWNGVAEGWSIASKRISTNKIKSSRLIKKRMDILCAANRIWRVQTAVKANFKTGLRFAEFLEYKKEGLMVGYGPDKTDYYLMARIYK